jgi:hypothetical protein
VVTFGGCTDEFCLPIGFSVFDGAQWSHTDDILFSYPGQTPYTTDAAIAYDAGADAFVVLAGDGGPSTWLLDAETYEWELGDADGGPADRSYPALAYDEDAGVTVFYGAASGETWIWDGTLRAWSEAKSASGPARSTVRSAGLAWASDERHVALLDDAGLLWRFDGETWTQRSVEQRSSIGGSNAPVHLAVDTAQDVVVAYEGDTPFRTGEWNGASFVVRDTGDPAPRGHALLDGPVLHALELVLPGPVLRATLWTWDGSAWSLAEQEDGGPRLVLEARDDDRDTLLFVDPLGPAFVAEWSAGGGWVYPEPPFASPTERDGGAGLAWDPNSGHVLLAGGIAAFQCDAQDVAYLWDGAAWIAAPGLPARHDFALVTDRVRGRVLAIGGIVGGSDCPPGSTVDDVWEFIGGVWQRLGMLPSRAPHPRTPLVAAVDPHTGLVIADVRGGQRWRLDVEGDLPPALVAHVPRSATALPAGADLVALTVLATASAPQGVEARVWTRDGWRSVVDSGGLDMLNSPGTVDDSVGPGGVEGLLLRDAFHVAVVASGTGRAATLAVDMLEVSLAYRLPPPP